MLTSTYDLVMNPDRNPLWALPKMVRFQYMVVLAYMWSAVFSIYIGAIALLGPSMFVHTILLIGIFFTGDIFRRAHKRALAYDQFFTDRVDGTAMHDDIWGAPPRDLQAEARARR